MAIDKLLIGGAALLAWLIYSYVVYPFYVSPFAHVPGPKLAAMSRWWIRWVDFGGHRAATIDALHRKYGKIVRVAPNEISFTGQEAMQKIYGAGSPFEKPPHFYNIFIAYGCRPLFAILDSATHASRKKLFSQMHSKSFVMAPPMESSLKEKISMWVNTIGDRSVKDVRTDFRYISVDIMSRHLWGDCGELNTLGSESDREISQLFVNPQGVYVPAWLIHFPRLTEFIESKFQFLGINPMRDIRDYARQAFKRYQQLPKEKTEKIQTIGDKLWTQHVSKGGQMTDDQIAAELSDLFLAGLDTTADTLTYVLWMLSKPEYSKIQEKLRNEVRTINYHDGIPALADTDKLLYLDAVLKETLRLFPINAGSQYRVSKKPVVIYDLNVPAGTMCDMQALTLNRDPEVFENPDNFEPERWMIPRESQRFKEMNRQLWTFSSGQRMCLGQHLAMAEMQLLVAAVYNKYVTTISPKTTDADMVFDDQVTLSGPMSRNCWIEFEIVQ